MKTLWVDKKRSSIRVVFVVLLYVFFGYLYSIFPFELSFTVEGIIVFYLFIIITAHFVYNLFFIKSLRITDTGILMDPSADGSILHFLTGYSLAYRRRAFLVPWSNIVRIRQKFSVTLNLLISINNLSVRVSSKNAFLVQPIYDTNGAIEMLDKIAPKNIIREDSGYKRK